MEEPIPESFPADPRARGTRGEILRLLRRRESTVAELGQDLGLTRNAVRQHLAGLERDRLIEPRGSERGVSKPSRRYGLSVAGRLVFARGHGPVMRALLDELRTHHRPAEIHGVLEQTGRRLAEGRVRDKASFPQRLETVRQTFEELGGDAVVSTDTRGASIKVHHCPLGDVTAAHPDVCLLAKGMVAAITGGHVEARCTHGDHPSCAFDVDRPRDAEPRG